MNAPANRYSVTQVRLWDNCQRAWAFVYVEGTRPPSSPWQDRGKNIHAELEAYARTGKIIGTYAERAVLDGVIPRPSELPSQAYLPEHKIEFQIRSGVNFLGFVDVIDMRADIAEIVDHKTLSDFRYCKTEEQLAVDTQLLTYAKLFAPEQVSVAHIYHLTRGKPRTKKISTVVQADRIDAAWRTTLARIEEMEVLRSTPDLIVDQVEATGAKTGHCSAYGGCPFRDRCGLPKVRFGKMAEGKENPLIAKLKSLGIKNASTEPAPAAAPAPSPSATQAAPPVPAPVQAPAPPVLAPDAAPRDTVPPAEEAVKRGPGRPRKTKSDEAPAVDPSEVEALRAELAAVRADHEKCLADNARLASELADSASVSPSPAPKGHVVYIDCVPTRGDGLEVMFEDWAAPALAEAAKVGEVPDAGLIDYKSKGVVAACLRELAVPPSIVLSTRSRWFDVATEILVPGARAIIRGMA